MEGLFDNILYIVITIVVLAFSMMNKKKKAEEAQRKTTQRPSTVFDPFEEIFSQRETEVDEMDEEEEIIQTAPEIRSILRDPVQSNEPRNEAFNPEVISAFSKAEKKPAVKVKEEKTIEDDMIIDMKYDWDNDEEKHPEIDFDLRTAVIQSEVLNRKYT